MATGNARPRGSAGSAERGSANASLDNEFYLLETSVAEHLQSLETAGDRHAQKLHNQDKLIGSLLSISHRHDAERLLAEQERAERGEESDIWEGKSIRRKRWSASRDVNKLSNCQSEWIGFRASCCGGRPVAVPIGCGHRLCFLCNSHRSEAYRDKVRHLFDRLTHPVFLTLTIPSVSKLTKKTITRVRQAFKQFLKDNSSYIKGGIYSIEITYSRERRAWHPHIHCLFDAACHLPKSRPNFIRFKKQLEFNWLLLTGGKRDGWRQKDFEFWNKATATHGKGDPWNKTNRRIVDVRPVRDRKKAAFEVLKYITKAAHIADIPEAIEQIIPATRGVRMLQTFGSWYGFKFDDPTENPGKAWSRLKCDCGENIWESLGRLTYEGVEMLPDGRWTVKEKITEIRCRDGGG